MDATGRIVGEAPLFAADTLVGDVALGDGKGTVFTRLGDWWADLCLLVVAAFFLSAHRSRTALRSASAAAISAA